MSAGAISQREVEQFEAQLRAAEAQLKALDEQIRQQRSQLSYYRVTAPIAGTVGDIPVNVGDRVTRSTVLTTVDENDVLEVYINVPVQQAPQLKLGLPVRLIDDRGQVLATNKITFVSPNVDTATQSVLAKAQLDRRPRPVPIRSIRARARRLDDGAGPDDSGDGRDSHQRAVLRVRRGEERRGTAWPSRSQCSWARSSATTTSCRAASRSGEQLIVARPAEDS